MTTFPFMKNIDLGPCSITSYLWEDAADVLPDMGNHLKPGLERAFSYLTKRVLLRILDVPLRGVAHAVVLWLAC